MAKIAAGTWLIAALSHEKDLYVWGHTLQQPVAEDHSCFKGLLDTNGPEGTPEDVHLIDIADGQDIEDVAVGDEPSGGANNNWRAMGLWEQRMWATGPWTRCKDHARQVGQGLQSRPNRKDSRYCSRPSEHLCCSRSPCSR